MPEKRASRLEGESAFSVLSRARALEAEGRDIIHLEIGQPDFPTPPHVVEAAVRALRDGHTGYGPSAGLPELREAVAEHAGGLRHIDVRPDQVVIAPGAKALLFYAIHAVAGEGGEVIYPDPGFPSYRSVIAHAGARPVPLPLREERGFRFDPDELRRLLSDRTRLVILNSPQNPTGSVLTRADLEIVADEASRRDFWVLSDEVYLHFTYDTAFESPASLPSLADRTILVDGFSKTYSMTGWRVGFAILPPPLAPVFDLYNVNVASCTCTFNQHGALAALRAPQDGVREMVLEFRRRRDRLVEGLAGLPGLRCALPPGAFYAFPSVGGTGLSSSRLARHLLDEAGVAVLDGKSFGSAGDGYLRLSYANSLENLERALERLGRWLERHAATAREGADRPTSGTDPTP